MLRCLTLILAVSLSGCSLLPDVSHQPTIHNPFPQLSVVAVAPFFNLTNEPTVDGRQFAMAYFNELQLVPGYEVVPVDVVSEACLANNLTLANANEARQLAEILGVDAVVIGAVTDYSPYYPPRCGMQVRWYAANPGFHPIPPGYGLPWGTIEEEEIPGPLVFEAEFALAKAQLKTQTPPYDALPAGVASGAGNSENGPAEPNSLPDGPWLPPGLATAYEAAADGSVALSGPTGVTSGRTNSTDMTGLGVPSDWPDASGFISPPPSPVRPTSWPSDEPVMQHTRTYNGHDLEFTEALASYHYFRDDARFGGWQSYLQRSDDFIRFCCHLHLSEMISARGGAGKTRVVWRWPNLR